MDKDNLTDFFGSRRITADDIKRKKHAEITDRRDVLRKIFLYRFPKSSGIRLHRRLLEITVVNYFCDICRLKVFRPVDYIDNHKKAAYTIKWLTKHRPIITQDGDNATKETIFINEYFAYYAGRELLGIDYDIISKYNTKLDPKSPENMGELAIKIIANFRD